MTLPSANNATGVSSSVSHCANPDCHAEFKRMGQGTLFVCPSDPEVTVNHLRQRVVWLCDACAREFEMPQIAVRQRAYSEADRPHQW